MQKVFKKQPINEHWNKYYLKYKAEIFFFNNKDIGKSIQDNTDLSNWTAEQSIKYFTGKLEDNQFNKLQYINFQFKKSSKHELINIYLLKSLYKIAPEKLNDFEDLINFEKKLIQKTKNNKLKKEEKLLLKNLNFDFNIKNVLKIN